MNALLHEIFAARLIQFGLFHEQSGAAPVRFEFTMLASYPGLLQRIAESFPPVEAERFLCTSAALPLGIAISLTRQIPLVYPRRQHNQWDLIGAYDIGHPTTLITNVLDHDDETGSLVTHADRVGLHVKEALAIIDTGRRPLSVKTISLFTLNTVIDELESVGELSTGQARAVRMWSDADALPGIR